ncbi:MAG: response regulator [Anaerolineales bacterium]|nr:response regulator [Anaerolineales bacterium]
MTLGDILIVENDPLVLEGNRRLFELEGYRVMTAGSVAEARELLTYRQVDLAIVDVRLSDDHDTYDRSGIELAEQMPPETVKLLVSAFDRYVYGPKMPYNVLHFEKQRGSRELVAEVKRLFREVVRRNGALEVVLQDGLTVLALLQQMKAFRGVPEALLTAVSEEFIQLLQRLFLRETRVELSYLLPGHGGAGVVLVRPFYPGKGAYVVVKFGLRDAIKQEVDNYREYVEPYIQINSTDLVGDLAMTKNLAAARFRFVGAYREGRVRDLATVYGDISQPDASIQAVIRDLFEDSCGLWYDGKQPWGSAMMRLGVGETAVSCYKKQLTLNLPAEWQELRDTLDDLLADPNTLFQRQSAGQIQLHRPGFAPDLLPDPVAFVEQFAAQLPSPVYGSITHGDINSSNVFVDEDGHTWLIDFSRTGWGPALRDTAELESVLLYELLDDPEIAQRLDFADVVLSPNRFSQPLQLPPHLAAQFSMTRARAAVQRVRHSAAQIVQGDEMGSYWVGLLFYALKTITWNNITGRGHDHCLASRQQALYVAARLCQKLAVISNR